MFLLFLIIGDYGAKGFFTFGVFGQDATTNQCVERLVDGTGLLCNYHEISTTCGQGNIAVDGNNDGYCYSNYGIIPLKGTRESIPGCNANVFGDINGRLLDLESCIGSRPAIKGFIKVGGRYFDVKFVLFARLVVGKGGRFGAFDFDLVRRFLDGIGFVDLRGEVACVITRDFRGYVDRATTSSGDVALIGWVYSCASFVEGLYSTRGYGGQSLQVFRDSTSGLGFFLGGVSTYYKGVYNGTND